MADISRSGAVRDLRSASHQSNYKTRLVLVESAIQERARRRGCFPSELFADPAWDILLQLYASELSANRTTLTHLIEEADVPGSITTRWAKALEDRGLVVRIGHDAPPDAAFILLTSTGFDTMARYFSVDEAEA